jgi:hypothetical protein
LIFDTINGFIGIGLSNNPAWNGPPDPERHVDRNKKRLVGERIEHGAELARHVEALG